MSRKHEPADGGNEPMNMNDVAKHLAEVLQGLRVGLLNIEDDEDIDAARSEVDKALALYGTAMESSNAAEAFGANHAQRPQLALSTGERAVDVLEQLLDISKSDAWNGSFRLDEALEESRSVVAGSRQVQESQRQQADSRDMRNRQGLPRYIVDGKEFPNDDSDFLGDGQYPPFVVFDVDKQENLPGEYLTRSDAQKVADAANAVPASPGYQTAADLVQRYQQLAAIGAGAGVVVHAGLADGALSEFFNPNAGGHVWVSNTLHRIGDQLVHVSADADSIGVYRPLHETSAEMASQALYKLCGEDRHLLLAEGSCGAPASTAQKAESSLRAFELTLPGFDGSTDATDDRVVWVTASNEDVIAAAIAGYNVKIESLSRAPSDDIDYVLPAETGALRARLSQQPEPQPVEPHPVFDVVNVGATPEDRVRAIFGCLVERHGWRKASYSETTLEKTFPGVLPGGGEGTISLSTQGTSMIKASWGWEDHGLLLIAVNHTPAVVAIDAEAAAELFVETLRDKHAAVTNGAQSIEDEPEGMSP